MDNFTSWGVGLDLKFNIDDKTIKTVKDTLDRLSGEAFVDVKKTMQGLADMGGISQDVIDGAAEQLRELRDIDSNISKTIAAMRALQELHTDEANVTIEKLNERLEQLQKARDELTKKPQEEEASKWKKIGDMIADAAGVKLLDIGAKIGDTIKSAFSDAWQELNNMLEYTRLTNATIREQAFTYGFTVPENYAFSKASQLLGISSEEDLMYMSDTQRAKFYEKFNEYSEKYSKLYDSGFFSDLENYNWEMQEFREDIQFELIQFFMDNKDLITSAMHGLIDLAEFTVSALGWIVRTLGGGEQRTISERMAAQREALGITNNQTNMTTNTTNVNVDNTFNGVSKQDQTWLANAGSMTYQQIIDALK